MKMRTGALCAAVAAAAAALIVFPAQSSAGAKNGVDYCLNILVPSLYPFMVLSVFVVKSGLAQKAGKHLEKFTQKVFRLPGCAAACLLMSLVGGYPAGARSVVSLYEDGGISERQARQMLCFCVNAGPSFVITAVGVGFFGSAAAGYTLFASQLIVFIILGIICGAISKKGESLPLQNAGKKIPASEALVISASDAAYSTLNMCCFVILFAALMNVLRVFVKQPAVSAVCSCILEVTGGCADLARAGAPLWTAAFAVGWGGVCVHFQIYASTAGLHINRAEFVLFRFLQGAMSAAVSYILTPLMPGCAETFSNFSGETAGALSSRAPAAAAMIALCAALLFSMPHEKLEVRHGGCYNKRGA